MTMGESVNKLEWVIKAGKEGARMFSSICCFSFLFMAAVFMALETREEDKPPLSPFMHD